MTVEARIIAKAKGLSATKDQLEKIETALSQSRRSVYRAVALDIDGTLTSDSRTHPVTRIDEDVAQLVADLINRATPVVLVTGRGSSARESARQIMSLTQTSAWQSTLLYCAPLNGALLWYTSYSSPEQLLSKSRNLAADFPFEVLEPIQSSLREATHKIERFIISKKTHSIRITTLSLDLHNTAFLALKERLPSLHPSPLFITKGHYQHQYTIDIGITNKRAGLEKIAREFLNLDPEQILCIGDAGVEEGNDFHFLNAISGYSVGSLSTACDGCFPVLDDNHKILTGVLATKHIIQTTTILPPIAVKATPAVEHLRTFEKLASRRAKRETSSIQSAVAYRLSQYVKDLGPYSEFTLSDIFDRRSGAVQMRDWELPEFSAIDTDNAFKCHPHGEAGSMDASMHSDTALLLRGPMYYRYFFSKHKLTSSIATFLENYAQFFSASSKSLSDLTIYSPSLAQVKYVLATADNARNVALILLSLALESSHAEKARLVQKVAVGSKLEAIARVNYELMLVGTQRFSATVENLHDAIKGLRSLIEDQEVQGLVRDYDKKLEFACQGREPEYESERERLYKAIFRWRECDYTLQNIGAIELGLREFSAKGLFRGRELAAFGVAHGGLELPFIAVVIADMLGVNLRAATIRVSHYSDEKAASNVRLGPRSLDDLEKLDAPVYKLSEAELPACCIVLDDNTTTGTTAEATRNALHKLKYQCNGVILVRYPGTNRVRHMQKPEHDSMLSLGAMFGFVRGLIAPSPYTRLSEHQARNTAQYGDELKVFDKAKDRIRRLLKKHGAI